MIDSAAGALLALSRRDAIMANVKGGKDHSDSIEALAGRTLRDPNAGKVAKRLAGAVVAHGDGKSVKPAPKKK